MKDINEQLNELAVHFYSTSQAAEALGVDGRTVRHAIEQKKLAAVWFMGQWAIGFKALQAYAREHYDQDIKPRTADELKPEWVNQLDVPTGNLPNFTRSRR